MIFLFINSTSIKKYNAYYTLMNITVGILKQEQDTTKIYSSRISDIFLKKNNIVYVEFKYVYH